MCPSLWSYVNDNFYIKSPGWTARAPGQAVTGDSAHGRCAHYSSHGQIPGTIDIDTDREPARELELSTNLYFDKRI